MRICCIAADLTNDYVLKVLSVVIIILGVVLITEDGSGFGYVTQRDMGDWWFALFIIVTGVIGVCTTKRRLMFYGIIFSVFAILATVIGTSFNTSKYLNEFKNMVTCYSSKKHKPSGSSAYQTQAKNCYELGDVEHVYDCYCVSNRNIKCYTYDLRHTRHCGDLLTVHKPTLLAAIFFGILSIVILVIYFTIALFTLRTETDITACFNVPIKDSATRYRRDPECGTDRGYLQALTEMTPVEMNTLSYGSVAHDYTARNAHHHEGHRYHSTNSHSDSSDIGRQYEVPQLQTENNMLKAHDLYIAMQGKLDIEQENDNGIDGEEDADEDGDGDGTDSSLVSNFDTDNTENLSMTINVSN